MATADVVAVIDVHVLGASLMVNAVGDGPGVRSGNKAELRVDGILIGGK